MFQEPYHSVKVSSILKIRFLFARMDEFMPGLGAVLGLELILLTARFYQILSMKHGLAIAS